MADETEKERLAAMLRRGDMAGFTAAAREAQRKARPDLPFPTTDASKWAREFVRLFGGDEGLMLAWFANAIEHGRGPDRPTPPAGRRLILVSEDLFDWMGTRTIGGTRLSYEWGEITPGGWYEPAITQHPEDSLGACVEVCAGEGHPGHAAPRGEEVVGA